MADASDDNDTAWYLKATGEGHAFAQNTMETGTGPGNVSGRRMVRLRDGTAGRGEEIRASGGEPRHHVSERTRCRVGLG